jgi:hypothetical protein
MDPGRAIARARSVGFSFFMPISASEPAGFVDACVHAFTSPTWCKPLRRLSLQVIPGKDYPRRRGLLPSNLRVAVLEEMLVHPDVRTVAVMTPGDGVDGRYGECTIETRSGVAESDLSMDGQQWIDLNAPARDDAWVTDMLQLAESTGVYHGIVTVMRARETTTEVSFVEMSLEGVTQHPWPDEFYRMRAVRRELGMRYVRFPRWGTIYSRAQVDALGGVDRIRETVRPAVVRELGTDALYFQLTASVATALGDEALEKQRAFTGLAEPFLPPPIASR